MAPKTDNKIKEKIYQIIAHQLGIDSESLSSSTELVSDLNIAPLDLVDIVASLEEQFKIEIPAEEAKSIKTLGDFETLINELINEI